MLTKIQLDQAAENQIRDMHVSEEDMSALNTAVRKELPSSYPNALSKTNQRLLVIRALTGTTLRQSKVLRGKLFPHGF